MNVKDIRLVTLFFSEIENYYGHTTTMSTSGDHDSNDANPTELTQTDSITLALEEANTAPTSEETCRSAPFNVIWELSLNASCANVGYTCFALSYPPFQSSHSKNITTFHV